jgi:dienelactone hydrolase
MPAVAGSLPAAVRRLWLRTALTGVCAAALAVPAGASGYSLDAEVRNFLKITERERYITLQPQFLVDLHLRSTEALLERTRAIAADPERLPANLCGIKGLECAGDIRFHDWHERADGIRFPVAFTARSGATLSGHVWAARNGPAERPAIVITTGSVQAPEELYWGQAATLAKHGYVVLTYDVQGQGGSDTLGEAPDTLEGVPSQEGQPFYDGTEDALDFLLSTASSPYVPRPSCTTGTSHAPKQRRRVGSGLNAAFNPLADLVDPGRIGIAGHSLGAAAVSFVGQRDPRVDAVVAWDNLHSPDEGITDIPRCPSAPATRETPPIAKPALGIANDYGIVATPFLRDPGPGQKSAAFRDYRDAGVDSGELVIRGGCHEESAFIPVGLTGPYPLPCGTLRGGDLIAWYTTAWFDKYVKGDPSADARLLTDRWRRDPRGSRVDLGRDGNLFSFYFRSPLNVALTGGGRAVCENLRTGCAALAPDGGAAGYDFVADAHSAPPAEAASLGGSSSAERAPAARADATRSSATLKKALRKCERNRGESRKRCLKSVGRRFVAAPARR